MYRSLVSIVLRLVGLGVALLSLTGCFPSPGPCDENAALELVYTADGIPAFAGQAVTQLSCGNGGFCHAESGEGGIPLAARYGAPAGLDFDVGIAATTAIRCSPECMDVPPDCAALPTPCAENFAQCCARLAPGARLRRSQANVLSMPGRILSQIDSGAMPPRGDGPDRYQCQITPSAPGCPMSGASDLRYDRFGDDGAVTRLPTLLDEDPGAREQAQEIMRNWLACGAPVVERTVAHREIENFGGLTVQACERFCVDVTWPAIYRQIIEPSCTSSACHDSVDSAGMLDLSSGAHAALLVPAEGSDCASAGQVRVVPGDPESSLLLDKLQASTTAEVCGAPMPQSRPPLSEQQLCAIRQWIQLGACADPTACPAATLEALDAARIACGFDASNAPSECAVLGSGCRNRP